MVLAKIAGAVSLIIGIFSLVFVNLSLRYVPGSIARSGIIISIFLIALGIYLMQL